MRPSPTSVFALLDWHNVQRYFAPDFHSHPVRELSPALFKVQDALVQVLRNFGHPTGYRVTTRVYHGWHSSRERTPVRRAFETFERDTALARRFGSVSFSAGFQFGNELACGSGRNSLYDTARSSGQKMVDTAICCDALHLLFHREAGLVVILSDDDDFIPAAITGSAWNHRIILLRPSGRTVTNVTDANCEDLLRYWSQP